MKNRLSILLLFLTLPLMAREVPEDQARQAALNFLIQNTSTNGKSSSGFELQLYQAEDRQLFSNPGQKRSGAEKALLYLFTINGEEGFIIVSAEDRARAILGYSLGGNADPENLPLNYRKWIEGYKMQIRHIRATQGENDTGMLEEWQRLLGRKSTGNSADGESTSAVPPLLSTKWDQSPWVNDLCPYDVSAGERTVSGCAATAMAQIMKFWNYPSTGAGYHSYSHESYGSLSANFGSSTYNWASMPDVISSSNEAVATLMYHCGVSIEMDYGIPSEGGSGAYVISDRSPGEHCVEYALENYFKYDPGLRGLVREQYSTTDWVNLLMAELDAGRPMEYAGFGSGGGHAFVCDGYDNNGFFHFNWGWGGYFDGYFSIDALDPGGTGIGGGTGGYNSGHQVLLGIKPPGDAAEYDLRMYSNLNINENPVFYGASIRVDGSIKNFSTERFTGDLCAAVFDTAQAFITYVDIIENLSLEAETSYSIWFENEGDLSLVPGDYSISFFYRSPGRNWEAFADGDYSNKLAMEVYYASDIELYSDFVLSTGEFITRGAAVQVSASVANAGSTVFTGDIAIDLFNLEGDFVETIQTLTDVSMDAGYYYEVTFESGPIVSDPGTYLMALTHRPTGGDWWLSGSSYAANPVHVIVKEAPLEADIYENNDTPEEAYILEAVFSASSVHIETSGSNMHLGTDVDYYLLNLEAGYNYSITARAHDSYSSEKQEIFTNDVLWVWATNEEVSELYDDVMEGTIQISNGGPLVFGVAPYFEGETGSYLLEIQLSRSEIVSTGNEQAEAPSVYPNPASEVVHISYPDDMDRIDIFDASGRKVKSIAANTDWLEINVSGMEEGMYFLHIISDNECSIHKVLIK